MIQFFVLYKKNTNKQNKRNTMTDALKIIKELVMEIFTLQTTIQELKAELKARDEKIKILSDKVLTYQLHQPLPTYY